MVSAMICHSDKVKQTQDPKMPEFFFFIKKKHNLLQFHVTSHNPVKNEKNKKTSTEQIVKVLYLGEEDSCLGSDVRVENMLLKYTK